MPNKKTASIQVLQKAMAVLKCFQKNSPELHIPEISEKLGIPKPTIHRILVTLERGNFVKKDPVTEAYHLGIGVLELASNFLNNMDVRTIALPVMEQLAKETGENVYLGIYDDGAAVNIHQEQGEKILAGYNRIGCRVSAHLSALGKVILANIGNEDLEKYMRSVNFEKRTANSIISKKQLIDELDAIKDNGYAIDNEEYEVGLKCIAAPIFDLNGTVVAAISISGPANRISKDFNPYLINKLKTAAKTISSNLGYFT